MTRREKVDQALFSFVKAYLGEQAAIDFDYSAFNDLLDEIEGASNQARTTNQRKESSHGDNQVL